MSTRKYHNGNTVLINKFWTTEGGGQLLEGDTIKAVVVSAEKTWTLGWIYKLKAERKLHIYYNEEDIIKLYKNNDPGFI